MSLAQRLRLPENTPKPLVVATVAYLGHLLLAPFAASTQLLVLIFYIAFFIALGRRDVRLSFHILWFPLILYGIASSISALAAERSSHMWADSVVWGKMFLFPAALILFRTVPRSHTLATRVFLFFGFGTGLVVIFQYYALGLRDLEHRVTWPASHVMTLSGMLVAASVFALALWLHDLRNPYLAVTTLVSSFGILITFTRSAWIGWVAAVLVLILMKRPRAVAWAVPVALVALSFAPLPFFGRLISSFDMRQSSNLDRIRMLEAGAEIIKDYPVLGVGPANIKEVYPLYRKHDAPRFRIPHLHNNIVQLWAERGVLAVIAYVMLIGLFVMECLRCSGGRSRPPAPEAGAATRAFAEAGVAVVVALTAAGLFEFNFGDTEVFWLLLDVLALVVFRLERPERSNEPAAGRVPPASVTFPP
ncbi:MAG: O-antigen ligase family protein [Acidobacteriota bacterium]